jgi:photosystem II stability/assembly factor-like uncharacterized protein
MNDGGNIAVSPHDTNIVFCAGNLYPSSVWNIAISHTSDFGTTWEHDTIPLGSNGLAVAFDLFDQNRVYVAGDSAYNYSYPQFLYTTDLGLTWNSSHAGITGRIWTIAADPAHQGVLYVGTYQGVFKSTDAGLTWANANFTSDTRALVLDPNDPNTIYAGTGSNGVYVSTDAGGSWTAMNDGLGNTKILALALRAGAENLLFAGTDGGSVYRTSVTTGVAGQTPIAVRHAPVAVSPNPCHASTTVNLNSLLLTAHSSLCVYDASGRLVQTFAVRTSSFELRTSSFAPGAYFVRLTSGNRTHTARLTVAE